MNITVGTIAVGLPLKPYGRPTIQNLGPGVIYFDRDDTVVVETGMRIEPGTVYTVPASDQFASRRPMGDVGGPVFLISDTPDTDVRFFI